MAPAPRVDFGGAGKRAARVRAKSLAHHNNYDLHQVKMCGIILSNNEQRLWGKLAIRSILSLAVGVIVALFALVFIYPRVDYCVPKMRHFTINEKIHAAAEYVSHEYLVDLTLKKDGSYYFRSYHPIPYSGAEEIMRKNPGCCTKDNRDHGRSTFATSSQFIRINYLVHYVDEYGKLNSVRRDTSVAVSQCGKIRQEH